MDVPSFIGASPATQLLNSELELAAQCDAKVLITGPSGVGKELVARLLHVRSRRHARPFVPLNCAAMPDSLLESELFGHERGSFTDAFRDKKGLLEAANGGTALLDEVGEMSLRMQALLLRFLENGEIQRVGSERGNFVSDVRVIAATNRKLSDRITTGEFREDLFYRLNVIHLSIPPLRERREDIAPLVRHFLRLYSERQGNAIPHLTVEALRLLERYDWPGNVRELRNVIERICARPITVITAASLPQEILNPVREVGTVAAAPRDGTVAQTMLHRIVEGGESFWDVAYSPFMTRDLTRDDLRQLILTGLQETRGSYKALVRAFNLDARDYRRFLNFLRKYDCHMPFQRFRAMPPKVERAEERQAATGR
jgi:DNA-binding NtrC family response regulator